MAVVANDDSHRQPPQTSGHSEASERLLESLRGDSEVAGEEASTEPTVSVPGATEKNEGRPGGGGAHL